MNGINGFRKYVNVINYVLLPGLDSDKKYFFDNQRRNIGHFKQTITSNEREFIVESNDVIENTF